MSATCSANEEKRHGPGVRGSCRGWADTPLTALARIRVERSHGRHPSFRRPSSCEEIKPSETAPSSSSQPPVAGLALSERSDQLRAVVAGQPANLGGWYSGNHQSFHRSRRPTFAQRAVEAARILFSRHQICLWDRDRSRWARAADRQICKRTFEYSRFAPPASANCHAEDIAPTDLPSIWGHAWGDRATFLWDSLDPC